MELLQLVKSAVISQTTLKPVVAVAVIAGFVSVAGGAETDVVVASDRSLAEIMTSIITPASDVLWNAVVFDITADGETFTGPTTDAEWDKVRTSAESLLAASDRMLSEDLPIKITEPTEPPLGELSPQQIADLRAANWQEWAAHVNLLNVTGTTAIGMIDARDAKGLSDVGNSLYEACESCHKKFWYPEG